MQEMTAAAWRKTNQLLNDNEALLKAIPGLRERVHLLLTDLTGDNDEDVGTHLRVDLPPTPLKRTPDLDSNTDCPMLCPCACSSKALTRAARGRRLTGRASRWARCCASTSSVVTCVDATACLRLTKTRGISSCEEFVRETKLGPDTHLNPRLCTERASGIV